MKFFHLSDLHIGLKLFNRDLLEDQQYILKQITEITAREQPDAIVIAGDIYDKAIPSAEAVALFDEFIANLSAAVPEAVIMMISGNHDSAPRVNVFRSVLSKQRIHMIGIAPQHPGEHIEDENGNNLSYHDTVHKLIEREAIDSSERNVLVSHQFYLPAGIASDSIERMDSARQKQDIL